MKNILKGLFVAMSCLMATSVSATDVTFTMSSIFDGSNQSATVTTPTAATVTTNATKSNAKDGKLGSDGHYFEIVLATETFTAASINGYINTNDQSKNWAFQFSTDGGTNWSSEVTQANDGTKSNHDIAVGVTIPAGANGFRVVRRAGTSTHVKSITLTLAAAGPVAVTGVTLNKTSLTLEAGQDETLTATVAPSNADNKDVSWSSDNPSVASVDQTGKVSAISAGTATITVTTADGNKTATCNVTVTAPAAQIPVTAISLDATATVGIGSTITLAVTYTPADANQGKAVTWTTADAGIAIVNNGVVTGVSAGTVAITATSTTDPSITATCNVTVQAIAVTDVSLNKSSLSLQIGGNETLTATVAPANATNKNITWESSNTAVATVNNGKVTGVAAGTATITVTTVDGNKTATCTVTVTAGPSVPSTTLSLHVPEIYEAKEIAGGYGGTLTVNSGNEYEVFYFCKISNAIAVGTSPISGNIATTTDKKRFEVKGGWMKGQFNEEAEGGTSEPKEDAPGSAEFQACYGDVKMGQPSEVSLHIKGYNEFAIYAYDNNTTPNSGKKRWIDVYIDDMQNPVTTGIAKSPASVRRYSISTGEHVIKLTSEYGGSKLYAISLRLPKEPRTRYLKGNDSTQVVMQTAAIKPITYVTKYNNIPGAVTELEWIGTAANGIELTKIDGELADTLVLSGTANCATGTYHYAVVAKYNGIETSRATGTFTVKSDIKATSEVEVDVYNNETMDQITFKYYALSDNDVIVTWPNGQPAGISGSGNNGKYIIGGTPNLTGTFPQTFPYRITVNGADTIISGKITVKELNYTDKSVLYLYKNSSAYQHDDIYKYLKNKGWDLIERKALEDGLRPAEQYRNYKFIIISEDADADNAEVLAVMKSGANLPVLNLKGFTYAHQRNEDTPDGWGEPDNGAIDTIEMKGRNIKIEQPSHPIFKKMNGVSNGKEIAILDSYGQHGVMPIRVTRPGTLCLATGYTRSTSDYYEAGELQTAIHEVPAGMNGGIKYICLSLSRTAVLSADGKKLIDGIVDYLTSDTQSDIDVPNCQIMTFTVAGKEGVVNHAAHSIVINMSVDEFQAADSLKNAEPVITLADPHTHVVPDSKELRYAAMGLPKKYTVTDYINLWVYEVSIRLYTPQGLEETYESGMWVNIFDIYGRKVATTNEDIYTMDLPHGMYIVVTETGSTLKIMR